MASIRFGTSGWRAVLAEDFTFGNARRVVAAIARTLEQDGRRGELLLVGFDTRFLAGRFAAEAGRIFLRAGFPAEISARPIPTPVLAFEILRRRAAGAVNFTASHNPPQYLGIKFSTSDGAPALPEVTQRIEASLASIGELPPPAPDPVPEFDPAPPYLAELRRKVRGEDVARGMPHFTLDFRYGTSAGFLDAYLEGAGAKLEGLHGKPDPLFGGESPQCGEKELVGLGRAVVTNASRLGLACDGDADRFGICDETGAYVQPNEILALLAADLLGRKGRRGGIARSVATTHALDAIAARYGVPLYETPVGFKYIGKKLIAGEIVFGGEESAGLTVEGHVPEKDGILADALVAEMAGATGKTLLQLREDLRREIGPFVSTRVDLPLTSGERAALARRRASPPDSLAGRKVASVNLLDGLKLIFADGSWILVRESGTEPVARVYVEAKSAADVSSLAEAAQGLLKE
ncbi:MAG TPA: phosphoglucomutase/phosphomannomutase family protein [Thermoanaerobaculia bacterium]|nr:phosphoglucomutase/phosphomannomutase family protein [Thermoanaerobaculia bacterium]